MPATFPAGKDGAVTLPYGAASDFNSFQITENQAVESVAAYGAAVYDPYRGSGTPHMSIDAAAFAKITAASTAPGFGTGTASAGGGSATFTAGTSTTIAGACVISQIQLSHSRIRAAVPLTYTMHNSGDMTTTWPIS